jgi:hypothetical protein
MGHSFRRRADRSHDTLVLLDESVDAGVGWSSSYRGRRDPRGRYRIDTKVSWSFHIPWGMLFRWRAHPVHK